MAKRLSDEEGCAIIQEIDPSIDIDDEETGASGQDQSLPEGVTLEDFHAYMPQHKYIFVPTREMWPAASVNSRIKPIPIIDKNGKPVRDEDGKPRRMKASAWLNQNRSVEQMTWAPGMLTLIENHLISDGGWIERNGVKTFNLYRPPTIIGGNPAAAGLWIEHAKTVFGDDAGHIILWLAHRVQRSHEKINHALVLGGAPGIGKDTLLEPVKYAVGHWNFAEVSPQKVLGRFNAFLKSVILRVSEARDLGDVNRFAFYDHMKALIAAPPDVLPVDEKNLREHMVPNVTGVIITTNYKTDGIFLPADDRRHFVAWSEMTEEQFAEDYWKALWSWYAAGGIGHVVAYLATLDLSSFNPKAPPPKTPAFWEIVNANRAPEDGELADVIEAMRNPHAITLAQIADQAGTIPATSMGYDEKTTKGRNSFEAWIRDRRNRRVIPHRMERCGYVPVRNDTAKDGLWKINGARQVVYARAELSIRERLEAAGKL